MKTLLKYLSFLPEERLVDLQEFVTTFPSVVREYLFPRLVVDIFSFWAILSSLGYIFAYLHFDYKFVLGALANYFLLVFAFVFNDMEDAADDKSAAYMRQSWADNIKMMFGFPTSQEKIPGIKRFKNPFAHQVWGRTAGYIFLGVLTTLALTFSWFAGGGWVLLIAAINLIIGFCYSWRKVRLKSMPFFDLLSHAFLLAGVQILYFLAFPTANITFFSVACLVLVFVYSVSGDLRNEYRDFQDDEQNGVSNTAMLLGKSLTHLISIALNILSTATIGLLLIYMLWQRYI